MKKFRALYYSAVSFLLLLFSVGMGITGLVLGANYGGNNGCIEYKGLQGYEACGTLFSEIGFALGIGISIVILLMSYKRTKQYEQ